MKKLVIIDGKSVFYRGYYAMGALSRADGTPTGGVYGFAAIAMEIVKELAPDKVVVAWDSKSSTAKRKAIYPEYKAGRTKPGDDFYAQIPLLEELVRDLGWGFVEVPEYEADDIIGTLAHQALAASVAGEEWTAYIVSSDLDMLQILGPNIKMYRILKGFSKLEELDVVAMEEKYGIKQVQFLDLKALKGDASDNIPGVPGVGEKTAVKLLNEYSDIDNIYAHLKEIGGAAAKKLEAGRKSAYMSRELAEIMFNAPVKLEDMPEFVIDKARIAAGLKKLEFNSLIRKFKLEGELGEDGDGGEEPEGENDGAEVADGGSDAAGGETRQEKTENDYASHDIIIAADIKKLMHERKRKAKAILEGGAEYWDLGQAEFLLNGAMDPKKESAMATGGKAQLKLDGGERRLEELYAQQRAGFEREPGLYKIFTEYDLPLIPVLYKMEERGMLIDRKYFEQMQVELTQQVNAVQADIWRQAGGEFNVNSPVQLSEVLFEWLRLPTVGIKKTSRGYSTGAKELAKLVDKHYIIRRIMEYREVSKLLNTYVATLPKMTDLEDRIHTTFTQNVTTTGRLSSVNPNLQNIPVRTEEGKKIRTGFIAGAGKKLVSADYSQFELRLAAVLAGDQPLIADFNAGIDIHTKTAAEVYGVPMEQVTKTQRRAAKVINFGVLYGMSAKGLSDATGMTVPEAKRFIDGYFELRRPIRVFLDRVLEQARNDGYVETYYGRRRATPDVQSSNYIVRAGAERAAQNMPIQGTEADLMKRAMVRVDKALPEGAELVLQVHDSLVVECDKAQVEAVSEVLRREMEGVAPELAIKLAVEVTVGDNWGEL